MEVCDKLFSEIEIGICGHEINRHKKSMLQGHFNKINVHNNVRVKTNFKFKNVEA